MFFFNKNKIELLMSNYTSKWIFNLIFNGETRGFIYIHVTLALVYFCILKVFLKKFKFFLFFLIFSNHFNFNAMILKIIFKK
jgi:hypothetical protein